MTIKFNQKQKDALAKVCDNIGVLNTGAIIVGVFVDYKITLINGIVMAMLSIFFFGLGLLLRGGE